MVYTVDNAVLQWEEGYRKLQRSRSDPSRFKALGRAVVAVEEELRKRLGSAFSVEELAALYGEGGDWAFERAIASRSPEGQLPDTATAIDAAFYLYMREAADFAGGRPSGGGP